MCNARLWCYPPLGVDCASAELAIVTPPIIEKSISWATPLVKVRTSIRDYVQVFLQDNLGLHAGTHFDLRIIRDRSSTIVRKFA
jgi:hypothetical protein